MNAVELAVDVGLVLAALAVGALVGIGAGLLIDHHLHPRLHLDPLEQRLLELGEIQHGRPLEDLEAMWDLPAREPR